MAVKPYLVHGWYRFQILRSSWVKRSNDIVAACTKGVISNGVAWGLHITITVMHWLPQPAVTSGQPQAVHVVAPPVHVHSGEWLSSLAQGQ